jgi:IclR family transcriptional regulator, acetate operon repressor
MGPPSHQPDPDATCRLVCSGMRKNSLQPVAGIEEEPTRPSYPIESVDNALRLLVLVAQQGQIRVSEAGAALGTATSTAHRLLAMLQYRGFVRQDPVTKTYHMGSELLRVGLAAVRDMDIRVQAHPFLEALCQEVDETVHMAIPQGTKMLFVDSVEGSKALRVMSRAGVMMWAHCTSVGKAYLALEPEDHLLTLYPNIELPGLASNSITSRARLFAALTEVRELGYATSANESEEGVGSVSMAVVGTDGRAVACISAAAPMARMGEERRRDIVSAIRQCTKQIAEALPWST